MFSLKINSQLPAKDNIVQISKKYYLPQSLKFENFTLDSIPNIISLVEKLATIDTQLLVLSFDLDQDCFLNIQFKKLLNVINTVPRVVLTLKVSNLSQRLDSMFQLEPVEITYPIYFFNAQNHLKTPIEVGLPKLQNDILTSLRNSKNTIHALMDESELNFDYQNVQNAIEVENVYVEMSQQIAEQALNSELNNTLTVQYEQNEAQSVEDNLELYQGERYNYQKFIDCFRPLIEETFGAYGTMDVRNSLAFLKQELFANLPQAIKYLSPDAAEYLAYNFVSFITLNKENLPDGFVLQKTNHGEIILHFDPLVENQKKNIFTPSVVDSSIPLYNITFVKKEVKQWFDNDNLYHKLCVGRDNRYKSPSFLIQTFTFHGPEIIRSFFDKLNHFDVDLVNLLIDKYLLFFPQWDSFITDDHFFDLVYTLKNYSEQKLQWFCLFFNGTGKSKHDLSATIAGFEYFWQELQSLKFSDNQLEILLATWELPKAKDCSYSWGHPLVYMERLLFIIKRTHLIELSKPEPISLSNYGAYYATRYEGFKTLHYTMHFVDDISVLEKEPFDKNLMIYQHSIEDLKDYTRSEFFLRTIASRYQEHNFDTNKKPHFSYVLIDCSHLDKFKLNDLDQVEDKSLITDWKKDSKSSSLLKIIEPFVLFRKTKGTHLQLVMDSVKKIPPFHRLLKISAFDMYRRIIANKLNPQHYHPFHEYFIGFDAAEHTQSNNAIVSLAKLMFVLNSEQIDAKELQLVESISTQLTQYFTEQLLYIVNKFYELWHMGITFDVKEGVFLMLAFASDFREQGRGIEIKSLTFEKFYGHAKNNKNGIKNLLSFKTQPGNLPKLLSIINIAEFLAQDSDVDTAFSHQLLLFSCLITYKNQVNYSADYISSADMEIEKQLLKIREILKKAAATEMNNTRYLFNILTRQQVCLSMDNFIQCCTELLNKNFNQELVLNILDSNNIVSRQLIDAKPQVQIKHDLSLEQSIKILQEIKFASGTDPIGWLNAIKEQAIVNCEDEPKNKAIIGFFSLASQTNFTAKLLIKKFFIDPQIEDIKNQAFRLHMDAAPTSFVTIFVSILQQLSDLRDWSDFTRYEYMLEQINLINPILNDILRKNSFEYTSEFCEALEHAYFDNLTSSHFNYLVTTFKHFDSVHNQKILQSILLELKKENAESNDLFLRLILDDLTEFKTFNLSEKFLFTYIKIRSNIRTEENIAVIETIKQLLAENPQDPILDYIANQTTLNSNNISLIGNHGLKYKLSKKLISFLSLFQDSNFVNKFLTQINELAIEKQYPVLHILSHLNWNNLDCHQVISSLIKLLNQYDAKFLKIIGTQFDVIPVDAKVFFDSLHSISEAQKSKLSTTDLLEMLRKNIETMPYGKRDVKQQFDRSAVEQVINSQVDLLNNSLHTFQYRKQQMEAFLLVHDLGYKLACFNNKPTKDLTNQEIKESFLQLYQDQSITTFNKRLLALALMREMMYRTTNQFPNSTQIIALIDCLMHEGDVIANINTGQGKSLIDCMKAALLWMDTERVDILTSSIDDVKRDIEIYGPFFKMLGIPFNEKPVTASCLAQDVLVQGVNFSTSSDMSLFLSKMKSTSQSLIDKNVSAVFNESDYLILDDQVIYRYANIDDSGLKSSQEWIYYEINQLVQEYIIEADRSLKISHIIFILKARAPTNTQRTAIDRLSTEQIHKLLIASIVAMRDLKLNKDYVIMENLVTKGAVQKSVKEIKILRKDGKVSEKSTFGNSVQQFLCAKHNAADTTRPFVIQPLTKTLIASNNKNLIDYYRSKRGQIWGSSGTTGSNIELANTASELMEQYQKYGFRFTQVAPHQKNQVKHFPMIILETEQDQQNELEKLLVKAHKKNAAPQLVFFKDIDSASAFFEGFKNRYKIDCQLNTGKEDEKSILKTAAIPKMITFTTSAIGRNSDIKYDKNLGLNVWHTCIDSSRVMGQKSGRTGRQGSKGEIHFVLNRMDFAKQGKERYFDQQNICAHIIENELRLAKQRIDNENLYNIYQYLLNLAVENVDQPMDFIHERWSEFSKELEQFFRKDHQLDNTIILQRFNQMMRAELPDKWQDINEFGENEKNTYIPYNVLKEKVQISDCMHSAYIAMEIMNTKNLLKPKNKESIKKELKKQMSGLNQKNYFDRSLAYRQFLLETQFSKSPVIEAHQEFFADLIGKSQRRNFFEKLFGSHINLKKLIQKNHFLTFCHAMTTLVKRVDNQQCSDYDENPQLSLLELPVLKSALHSLLDDYLVSSWFISTERKGWARELKSQINQVQNFDELFNIFVSKQIAIAEKDIEHNKNRKVKSIHFFGSSRLQDTLSQAIKLITAFSPEMKLSAQQNEDILKSLQSLTSNSLQAQINYDDVKLALSGSKGDKSNLKVLQQVIENLLKTQHEPHQIEGRNILSKK